jgi:hypothetical protein
MQNGGKNFWSLRTRKDRVSNAGLTTDFPQPHGYSHNVPDQPTDWHEAASIFSSATHHLTDHLVMGGQRI